MIKNLKVLIFENVYFSYDGEEVLRNVSFDINDGEVVTLVGPNGGGKTTLVKLILGLIKPIDGRIYLYGKAPESSRKLVGYLPQMSSVNRNIPITAFDFVKISFYKGLFFPYPSDIDKKVNEVLKMVEAYEFRYKTISELSGGQFQRILLARAIINEPQMLILDEPTNFIDEKSRKNFYEIIMSFKGKKTMIIVSHDLNMVSKFTDRVLCLNREMFISCKVEELDKNLDMIYNSLFSYVEHRH